MLDKIIAFALGHRGWFIAGTLLIVVLGIEAFFHIPIDAVPDITNVQVVVNTKTGALDPAKVERLVTYPIETEMFGLQNVEEVRSLSKYGLSQIVIVFEESMNIYFARQLVAEKLQSVRGNLPQNLAPELAPVTTGLGEVLMYVLNAKPGSELAKQDEKQQLIYLRQVQDFVLRPRLKTLNGVAEVDTGGGYLKQIHINIYPEKLQQLGLSLEKLIAQLDTVGESFGGGYIQKDGHQLIVRSTGRIEDLKTIENISLGLNYRGRPIHVSDVATVSVDHALRLGAATHLGHETVLGTVLMRTGANSREVAASAEEALKKNGLIPDDVELKIVYSRGHLVNATIHTIFKNLAEGAVLVIIVLFLLLGHVRAALLVALAIPISMLCALKGMQLFGVSANLMSLGAIDFGLLVDGSVVLIENIIRRLQLSKSNLSLPAKLQLILEASQEVVRPLVFGLLIIMLVYVPILYLEGVEGKMFRPMAITVLLALGASLLVALLLMPVLAFIFLHHEHKSSEAEPKLLSVIRSRYEPLLQLTQKRISVVVAIAVLPLILALVLVFRLGFDFVPALDEGDLVINLSRETQQDIDTSVDWQKKIEALILKYGEVETVFSRMGTPESALDPMSPSLADTFVILKKDFSQWPLINGHRRSKNELYLDISNEIKRLNPQQEVADTQPIEMRFNEMLEGSRADVSLRVFGPDLDKLLSYTQAIQSLLAKVSGVSSIESDPLTQLTRSPVLDVTLDYGKMASYGVGLSNVNGVLEHAMSGRVVGSYFENDRRFPVVIHLTENLRNQIGEIAKIPIELPGGGTIPLSTVSHFKEQDQVTTVARSAGRRYSGVSIYLKDRDIASFVSEAKATLKQQLKLDADYEITWGGQFKNLEKAQKKLAFIIPLTLIGILLLLIKGFGNLRHAALVFSAVPLATVGGVIALWLRGINLSVSAAVGFIALAGIAILNSMVLVSFFNHLRAEGISLSETVVRGSLARLRPVMTTALVASLGFLPMAFNTGTGAEVQRPLATVVIGGLITSTILTLLLIPAAYRWLEEKSL